MVLEFEDFLRPRLRLCLEKREHLPGVVVVAKVVHGNHTQGLENVRLIVEIRDVLRRSVLEDLVHDVGHDVAVVNQDPPEPG